MTNLEFYKDEIKEKIKNGESFVCAICQAKNKNCPQCSADDGDDVLCNVVDWLLEEHKETIKLKQWEKDLLEKFNKSQFFDYESPLFKMKDDGYFKGVTDTSMALKEILDNCEVSENE